MITKEKTKSINLDVPGLFLKQDGEEISLYDGDAKVTTFKNCSWQQVIEWVRKNLKNVRVIKEI